MEIVNAKSSTINWFSYDAETKALIVEFKNGNKYEYTEVPDETFRKMSLAESTGRFHATELKGKFEFKKLV